MIDGLSDADAAGCTTKRRSTPGGCLRVGQHTLTTWESGVTEQRGGRQVQHGTLLQVRPSGWPILYESWDTRLTHESPQSSWQTYTEPVAQHNPCVFRPHVPEPPDEPLTLKPYVPEIIHQRVRFHRSDSEILTHFDEGISSVRDGYTAWVLSHAETTRDRLMVSKRGVAPAFGKASEKKSLSQLIGISQPGRHRRWCH